MLLMKFLVNCRLLVAKLWGSQKLLSEFQLLRGLVPLIPALFKIQLYVIDDDFLLIYLSLFI